MATLFTRILQGELPGRFVYRDELCAAFLSIHPLQPGHTLVVPVAEVDHWLDLPADLLQHLTAVAQRIGQAQQRLFRPTKVGLMLAGLEVPHVHFHVVPIHEAHDLNFGRQNTQPDPQELDEVCQQLRQAVEQAH